MREMPGNLAHKTARGLTVLNSQHAAPETVMLIVIR